MLSIDSHLRARRITPLLLLLFAAGPLFAVEHVTADVDGRPRKLSGKLVAEGALGNMLLETDDGAYWFIEADDVRSRTSDDKPLVPLSKEALGDRLLEELGPGFQIHRSKNYVVAYNTTLTYAKWCSSLLERLQRAFIAHWKKQGCKVKAPDAPLTVLIFSDQSSYAQYARPELGSAARNVIGYYSFQSNRIVMYDLTGMQKLRRANSKRGTLHDITALLSQPAAEPLVATIVHEATHQISFNCGLQTRYSNPPLWMSEGLAAYFETPDLTGKRGWSGIGKVNYSRWDRYRQSVATGRNVPLKRLLTDDAVLQNPKTAVDAYAASWAWTYFLAKWHPKEYVAYLKMLRDKPLMQVDEPARELADFERHFGDLRKLEEDFSRRMSRIK